MRQHADHSQWHPEYDSVTAWLDAEAPAADTPTLLPPPRWRPVGEPHPDPGPEAGTL